MDIKKIIRAAMAEEGLIADSELPTPPGTPVGPVHESMNKPEIAPSVFPPKDGESVVAKGGGGGGGHGGGGARPSMPPNHSAPAKSAPNQTNMPPRLNNQLPLPRQGLPFQQQQGQQQGQQQQGAPGQPAPAAVPQVNIPNADETKQELKQQLVERILQKIQQEQEQQVNEMLPKPEVSPNEQGKAELPPDEKPPEEEGEGELPPDEGEIESEQSELPPEEGGMEPPPQEPEELPPEDGEISPQEEEPMEQGGEEELPPEDGEISPQEEEEQEEEPMESPSEEKPQVNPTNLVVGSAKSITAADEDAPELSMDTPITGDNITDALSNLDYFLENEPDEDVEEADSDVEDAEDEEKSSKKKKKEKEVVHILEVVHNLLDTVKLLVNKHPVKKASVEDIATAEIRRIMATEFDSQKELEHYKQNHVVKPSTKLEVKPRIRTDKHVPPKNDNPSQAPEQAPVEQQAPEQAPETPTPTDMQGRPHETNEGGWPKSVDKPESPFEKPAEESKKEEPKTEEAPKSEEPKKEEPKTEEPKKEEPKKTEEAPKSEEPKQETPAPKKPAKKELTPDEKKSEMSKAKKNYENGKAFLNNPDNFSDEDVRQNAQKAIEEDYAKAKKQFGSPEDEKSEEKPAEEKSEKSEKKEKHKKEPEESISGDDEPAMKEKGFGKQKVDKFDDDMEFTDVSTGQKYKYKDLPEETKQELNSMNDSEGIWHEPKAQKNETKEPAKKEQEPMEFPKEETPKLNKGPEIEESETAPKLPKKQQEEIQKKIEQNPKSKENREKDKANKDMWDKFDENTAGPQKDKSDKEKWDDVDKQGDKAKAQKEKKTEDKRIKDFKEKDLAEMGNHVTNYSHADIDEAIGPEKKPELHKAVKEVKREVKKNPAIVKDYFKTHGNKGTMGDLMKWLTDSFPKIQNSPKPAMASVIEYRIMSSMMADKIAADIILSGRKDQDLMSDTGGKSKTPLKEPSLKPSRHDVKDPYRLKNKTKEQKDPDTDMDKDLS